MTGSIVIRRSLGRQLRALRIAAGKTPADVNTAGIASASKLSRIETGMGAKVSDVRTLCWLYGVDAATTDTLTEMALNASGPAWWEDYGDVMHPWFAMFVELEQVATRALVYDPVLVYGLLQTPEYARAVHDADPALTAEQAERLVSLRVDRQRTAAEREPPLQITFVTEPGALAREVGGRSVAHDQRRHLCEASRQPHIDVRVLPYTEGAHPAMQGAFTILGFDSPEDPDVVYLETRAGARYIEKEAVVRDHHALFAGIHRMSIPVEEHLS